MLSNQVLQPKKYFESEEFDRLYYYEEEDLGVSYTKNKTVFRVWAPTAEEVNVLLYTSGVDGELDRRIPMKNDIKGTWVIEVEGDLKGKFYTYEVAVNENVQEVMDPYAKAVGVNGMRGMVVDLSETNPEGWEQDQKPEFHTMTDAIIYELHVRDVSISETSGISHKGKYLGLTETGTKSPEGEVTGLDHMVDLGITHLHLLPIFDYLSIDESRTNEAQYNWGYDPQNYNVPEGSYATDPFSGTARIKELKQMVKVLHEQGIRVVMDVVYNHTGKSYDSHLNHLVPDYYYRQNKDGSFSNDSGCGNGTASERSMVRKMIIDSIVYWAKEYHMDGFRFDLMGIHDIDTMNQIREAVDQIDPSILLYGEGWTAGGCPLSEDEQALKKHAHKLNRIAVFSDDLRDGIKGSYCDVEAKGFANGEVGMEENVKFGIVGAIAHPQVDCSKVSYSDKPWASGPYQSVNYVSCHDNHTLWDKLELTNPEDSEEERIKIYKLSNAIVLTAQGIPFLHAGVEMARTKFGVENSYNSSDAINQMDWSRKSEYKYIYAYYKGLIDLRKNHPAFRMTSTQDINTHLEFLEMPSENMIGYILKDHANGDLAEHIVVVFNANVEDQEIVLPYEGWEVYVNGEQAGNMPIKNIEGNVITITARSTMVLIKK